MLFKKHVSIDATGAERTDTASSFLPNFSFVFESDWLAPRLASMLQPKRSFGEIDSRIRPF
jgi:hypothetical protein